MTTCCSKGCNKKARLQVGWRAYHCDVPVPARTIARPIEAYTNQVVCKDHIPVSIPQLLPPIEIARINAFMVNSAKRPALDLEHGEIIVRKFTGQVPTPTVMHPVAVESSIKH